MPMTPANCLTSKTPCLVQHLWLYFLYLPSFSHFQSKFPNFRCHGNRDRSDINFNDTSKLPDLENPLFGATFMALCDILAEFCVKIPKFSLPWQQGLSDVYFNNTIQLLDLENPLFGATRVALFLVLAEF